MSTAQQESKAVEAPRPPKASAKYRALLDGFASVSLTERSAAMLAAHAVYELGEKRATSITQAEAKAYAEKFQRVYPAAWGAIIRCNGFGFDRLLTAHGLDHDDSKNYQRTIDAILG